MTLNGFEESVGRAGQLLAGPQQQLPWVEWHNLEFRKKRGIFFHFMQRGSIPRLPIACRKAGVKIILFRSRIYFVCLILIYRIASGLALYLTEHYRIQPAIGELGQWQFYRDIAKYASNDYLLLVQFRCILQIGVLFLRFFPGLFVL